MYKYHVYEEEARGKHSIVFKARRKKKIQFVAIKRVDKSRKAKIVNQAKILQELIHPNIIRFHEFIETNNHIWAVTEYCPGGDILKLIEHDKTFPEPVVRDFVKEIMRALSYTHSKGIILCDLKPAGILINQYGNIKLADFGSAQLLLNLMHNYNEKKKGTPSYMGPELFETNSVYSFASDLWSLGCIMYELAQGNPPFVSPNIHQIAQLAKSAETPKVDFFSSDFNNLLERLLAKNPDDRIQWSQIFQHPWIKGEITPINFPKQHHFEELKKKNNSETQMLRVSNQFEGYGDKKILANDRREEFVFENDAEEQEDYGLDEKMAMDETLKILPNSKKEVNITKRAKQVAEMQDSANMNVFMQTLSTKNLPPLQEAISHQSDNSVKPIIGNKDIEPIESSTFNKKALGFAYIEPEMLAEGIVNGEMEVQLKRILDGMTGDQKINVLGYFQTIIQNSDVANYLFKTNFISFYMKLMKGYKQSTLRAKMCQILGLLIRHATSIDPQILKYGIINGFLEAVKDKNERVRRKAMAALGQLLFYGATQVDEKINEWDLSMNLIHSLLKILKSPNQDEIVRIYCCKSIENITAQAKQVGLKFAQLDTLLVLISSFNSTKNEVFRASISCCLHHIIILNMTLREVFLEKIGMTNIVQTFKSSETNHKTNQILLWILLTQCQKSPKSKMTKMLLEDDTILFAIFLLLDSTSAVVKGRAYIYMYLVLEGNIKKAVLLLESKLFHAIERQGKQNGKYESQCLQFVLAILYESYCKLIKLAEEDIRKCVKNGGVSSGNKKHSFMGVLCHMMNSSIFEDLLENYEHIEELICLMNLFDIKCDNHLFQVMKNQFMQTIEKILTNNSITEKMQENYSTSLLPFLMGKILKSTENDIRFSCMKYLLYLVNIYLSDENIYDSTILSITTNRISSMINDHLIPQLNTLLNSDQTVASITLKLIAVLFQISSAFIKRFYQTCSISSILTFYNEHSNVNILKVVQALVSSSFLSPEHLQSFLPVALLLLAHYSVSGQQIFLEYPLDILKCLVKFCTQDQVDQIWECTLPLQTHQDLIIREKSELLIEQFLANQKISIKGKWDIKDKKSQENYEAFKKMKNKETENLAEPIKKKSQKVK